MSPKLPLSTSEKTKPTDRFPNQSTGQHAPPGRGGVAGMVAPPQQLGPLEDGGSLPAPLWLGVNLSCHFVCMALK